MKEITYFYMRGCPFCRRADDFISELIQENPAFSAVKINKIEERENSALARSYDYFYVPCLWLGGQKLHEGVPTKEKIRMCLESALKTS